MLYLPHDIPGMESLESLYDSIWKKIQLLSESTCNSPDGIHQESMNKHRLLKVIKRDILHDLYGVIEKDDLETILGVTDLAERAALWSHLVNNRIIDHYGKLLIMKIDEYKPYQYTYDPGFNEKVIF